MPCKPLPVSRPLQWELLSIFATGLAVWAFFVNSSEKSYEAFLAALRFEDLAHEVDLATLDALHSANRAELEAGYRAFLDKLRNELQHAGPRHSHYGAEHAGRLTQVLAQALRQEGRASPTGLKGPDRDVI